MQRKQKLFNKNVKQAIWQAKEQYKNKVEQKVMQHEQKHEVRKEGWKNQQVLYIFFFLNQPLMSIGMTGEGGNTNVVHKKINIFGLIS